MRTTTELDSYFMHNLPLFDFALTKLISPIITLFKINFIRKFDLHTHAELHTQGEGTLPPPPFKI